jgi:tetratricopeptide (TPR) repeat protein
VTELPTVLLDEIAGRRCVFFLGPDISESYGGYRGLPTTWQLADELAAECGYRGQYCPLPRIAQIYEHRLGKQRLIQYLRDRLAGDGYQPLPIHEIIARIPLPAAVYAGWDRLLEMALERQGQAYQVIITEVDVGLIRSDRRLIYKPYGSLDRPDSLVITEERQLDVLTPSSVLLGELRQLLARYCLLLIGYAVDYDSVFAQLYHQIRQTQAEFRPPAFVVQALHRAEDAVYWEALGIRSIVTDPTRFLRDLALRAAEAQGQAITLPDVEALSQAQRATPDDLRTYTSTLNRVMGTLGIGELVEKSEIPLLTADQVRDLETMRAAYERLAQVLGDPAESATMWLRQGNIEYGRSNYDTAESYYQRALAVQPDLAEAHHNLHYVYLAQANLLSATDDNRAAGKLDQALQAYRQAIELKPDLAILPGRYSLDAVLGQGGVGVVYRARDAQTGQVVAVKLLDRAHMNSEKAISRFCREAAILQRLQHPHIVRILKAGQHKGRHFIVLEYLGEESLRRLLRAQGRLPLDQAADIVQQVGQAVQAAHGAGIIHRDLKPSNVFLEAGQAKVIDFGLAADLQAGLPSVLGIATGTVRYMSPEQQMGAPVDERTDLYALATILYEMLTGRHPDEGTYQPISALVQGTNAALDIVVERARQQRPDDRYGGVEPFLVELARVVPTQPASERSALWRRGIARLQRAISRVTTDYWFVLIALSLIAGFGLTSLSDTVAGRLTGLSLGLAIWDLFLMNVLTQLYTPVLARRSGYGTLAAFGPLWGTLLGLAAALIAWRTATWSERDGFGGDWTDYAVQYLLHGAFVVVVAVLGYAGLASGTYLALRLRLGPRRGLLLVYGLGLLLLAILAYILNVIFLG